MTPPAIIVRALARLLRLATRSWRLTFVLPDGSVQARDDYAIGRKVYAVSERDLFVGMALAPRARPTVLVAEGSDGDWAAIAAAQFGVDAVRGSTLHHPTAAAREFIRALRATAAPALLVVDGPLGPPGTAKAGIATIAALSGRPIVVAAAAARPAITFSGSWSGIYLPVPFARVVVATGSEIQPAANDRDERTRIAARVTGDLAALTATARAGVRREGAVA